jgi:AraC-like DNA-binding protein
MVGAHFRHGGVSPFLSIPVRELQDVIAPLGLFWPGDTERLVDRLLAVDAPASRLCVLEEFLRCHIIGSRPFHPAVAAALGTFETEPGGRVADIVERVGLSAGRFIRLFTDEVGLPPKLFSRIHRFQRVVRAVHGAAAVDWADVAASSGYYDQAHLIYDFKAFSGLTPTAYLGRRGPYPNHVPLDG